MKAAAIPSPPPPEKLNLEARKQILNREIARYSQHGYRVVSRTDTTVQMIRPKEFSCLWATVWLLVFIVGLLVYVFYYLSKKDEMIYLEVDDWGRVHKR